MTQKLIPTRVPRKHQSDALEACRGKNSFFLLMDMGTGKSKITVDEFLQLYLDVEIDRVLIVAGKGSLDDWHWKHLPENVPSTIPYVAHLWRGNTTKREENDLAALMNRTFEMGPCLRVLIMNVEAFQLPNSRAENIARLFLKDSRAMIVCDESTKIRNETAHRTKVMIALGRMATHRRALTGLPTPKSPLDLWGQLMFLGVEDRMAPNWWAFRARYCIVEDTTIHRRNPNNGRVEAIKKKVVVGTRNLDQLQVRMAPFSFRALKADCLDLPPKIYEQATVHLSVAQQRAYHEMMKFATTELEAGLFASAKNAVGRITRLHQITCGFLVAEDGSVTELDNGRLVALTDTIDEMSGSLIIWCAYQQDVRRVTRHLHAIYPDRTVVQYYGPTPQSERAANVQAFQDGHADFFVGTAATGGFGITLTAAHNVIYYSCSFDLEHRLQSEDRCHRDGQTCAVTYVDLVANRTVDVKVLRALRDKKNVADAIMGDGVRAWLEL